ncbi:hypothetical protein E3E12_04105 [Formicincola oecophyllae]|uniref:Glycosyltransferase RgtA/B/C/D-like domain-containing protein n=1 Tax=Formicincola oecophyllae TaxID=2558361 RepID=A0A4Y6U8J7_9PROT|nr:hypothetical protein [Formicincola oecophyllae]QDH13514.2 hypothetical protein E3E12_04105 [Formicincola oecophyllae]
MVDLDLLNRKNKHVHSQLSEATYPTCAMVVGLLLAALLAQVGAYGNPFPFIDQQFYLYGGGQILQGSVPYVDFWDRKPVGLFLFYGLIRLTGSWRFWVLPLVAALSLWVGAWGLTLTAYRLRPSPSAMVAGLLFIEASASSIMKIGGQAENFYLPLVIWAMALPLSSWQRIAINLKSLFLVGCASMALFGFALQIKPSCVLEGILLGLALLIMLTKQALPTMSKVKALFFCGAVWVALAAAPTMAVAFWYWLHGFGPEWLYANLGNLQYRDPSAQYHHVLHFLENIATATMFYMPVLVYTLWQWPRLKRQKAQILFILLWGLVAFGMGVKLRSGYGSTHYLLPAVPALALLAVYWAGEGGWRKAIPWLLGAGFLPGLLWANFFVSPFSLHGQRDRVFYHYSQLILRQQPGCLLGLGGEWMMQDLSAATASCHVTKFTFPDHLLDPQEWRALGVGQQQEVMRSLALRPLYVVYQLHPTAESCQTNPSCRYTRGRQVFWRHTPYRDLETQIQKVLAQDYVPVIINPEIYDDPPFTLYKLKPGLLPHIVPKGFSPSPSNTVAVPWLRIPSPSTP